MTLQEKKTTLNKAKQKTKTKPKKPKQNKQQQQNKTTTTKKQKQPINIQNSKISNTISYMGAFDLLNHCHSFIQHSLCATGLRLKFRMYSTARTGLASH